MEHVLLVVQVLVAAALIGIILIQRSDTDGFGLGSGSGMNFMSGRSTASLLTRTTAILATLFIVNSLVLSIIASRSGHQSIVEQIEQQQTGQPAPATAPAVPTDNTTLDLRHDAAPVAKKVTQDKAAKDTSDAVKTQEKKAPAVPAAQ